MPISELPAPYYDEDGITIYHGDCRDILPHLPKFDLLLTDPPYDIRAGDGGGGWLGNRKCLVKTEGFTDNGVDYGFLSGVDNWICFCSKKQLLELMSIASLRDRWNLLTWAKPSCTPLCYNKYLPDVEFAIHVWEKNRLFSGVEDKNSFSLVATGSKNTGHPNEKPIKLIEKYVRLGSQPGDTICDPFMGSGTTLVAAKFQNRKAVGIEREKEYCDIAIERLAQKVLF